MKFRHISFLFVGLSVIIGFQLTSCNNKAAEGKKLAQTYCSSCHILPEPNMLPQNVWQYSTLPYMGILMGVDKEIENLQKPLSDYSILKPESQIISNKDWEKIKEYYLSESPKTLSFPEYTTLEDASSRFDIQKVELNLKDAKIANYTSIKIDATNNRIIAGDQSNRVIWVLDNTGKPIQTIKDQNALTDVQMVNSAKGEYLLTYIGTTTQANPDVNGSVDVATISGTSFTKKQTLLSDLNRPIEVLNENIDENPDNELIVNEFGFLKGGLSVWKKDSKGFFQKQILSSQTGATKTILLDYDKDGRKDILALIAQGDERILLYLNKGNMKFEEKQLLRFPSIYGSSSFDIADINKDGKIDIVYTAGDNADFSTILKPYHGVYVFLNNGNYQFKQSNFFQQNGATKVIPNDFDNDGDIDLISIALFLDTEKRPLEGFMYFENNGNNFTQKTLPINHLGRWCVADAADIDHDGDLDIVLGSHPVAKFPTTFDQAWKQGSGLLILRNKTK